MYLRDHASCCGPRRLTRSTTGAGVLPFKLDVEPTRYQIVWSVEMSNGASYTANRCPFLVAVED